MKKSYTHFKIYDELEYDSIDHNIPIDFIFEPNIMHVVRIEVDIDGNYSIRSNYQFEVKQLNNLKNINEIKDVLDDCMFKYYEQRDIRIKEAQKERDDMIALVDSIYLRRIARRINPKSKLIH